MREEYQNSGQLFGQWPLCTNRAGNKIAARMGISEGSKLILNPQHEFFHSDKSGCTGLALMPSCSLTCQLALA